MDKKKINRTMYWVLTGIAFMSIGESYMSELYWFPYWPASFLFLPAISVFEREIETAKLLKPLCIVSGTLDFTVWLTTVCKINLPFSTYFLNLLSAVLSLYLTFQLVTDIATLANKYGFTDTGSIITARNFRAVYAAIAVLVSPLWNKYDLSLIESLFNLTGFYSVFFIGYSFRGFRRFLTGEKRKKKDNEVYKQEGYCWSPNDDKK